jgi:hypothetical protein
MAAKIDFTQAHNKYLSMEVAFTNKDSAGSLFMLSPEKLERQMGQMIVLSGVVLLPGLLAGWYFYTVQQLPAGSWLVAMVLVLLLLANLYFFFFHFGNAGESVWLWLDMEEMLILKGNDVTYREKVDNLEINHLNRGAENPAIFIKGETMPEICLEALKLTGQRPPAALKEPQRFKLNSRKDFDRLDKVLSALSAISKKEFA